MAGRRTILLAMLTLSVSYYIYTPIPEGIQEPWRLMMLDAVMRTMHHAETLSSWFGTSVDFKFLFNNEAPSGGVKITDITFADVPVRVYEPPAGGEGHLRRGVLYMHGGGWTLGSNKDGWYDTQCRKLSDELNAVVVSVEYRLYPNVTFPEPYLDCLNAAKHFLSPDILAKYSVDPDRVAVSGDSAGGNLAAAVVQEISQDESVVVKFSLQALIYPVTQAVDFNTPSYIENHNVPPLSSFRMVLFWLQYLGADLSWVEPTKMSQNSHSSTDQVTPEIWARVDWTSLLPPRYKKNHQLVRGEKKSTINVPGLLDVRASPLLAASEVLAQTPRAYILIAEHDVLRDDGLMYARRLLDAGVPVHVDHYEDGFHGCVSFADGPFSFEVGKRSLRNYISWLQNNL